jgi:hypothetical protein
MLWFVGSHPKYCAEKENPVRDFLESGADILFSIIDLAQKIGGVKDSRLRDKTLVLFVDNPTNDPILWKAIPLLLENLKPIWGGIIVSAPPDNRMREITQSILSLSHYFPLWVNLPYTYRLYQKGVEPHYGDYLLAWVAIPLKGKREIDAASFFIKIKIHDYSSGGPTIWSHQMQFESRGLIWAATRESSSRALVSAGVSKKPAVMLRTTAQLWDICLSIDSAFLESAIVRDNLWDWLLAGHQVLENLDYAIEWGLKLYNFFEKHEELWKWEIIWQRFYDQTGLKLPKDMTFVHHLSPNYFGSGYFDMDEYFPQGPWLNELPSVNWETGLGL